MLTEIFKSVLLMSAVGGALSAFLLCVKPITRKLFSPKWQYYIWLTVLIVMVLPVSFSLPKHTPDIPDIMTEQVRNVQTEIDVPADNKNTIAETQTQPQTFSIPEINLPQNIWEYLSAIWIFAAAAILLTRITKYYLFLRTIRKHSSKDTSISNIPKRLRVRRTDMLDAPLIVGLIKPVLYLPDTELSENNLNYILMHELTHYKRRDLLYKWAALVIKSVHWFNPFVYLVSKQIDLDCEVSCDFAVTSNLTHDEQNNYMNMILGLLINSRSNLRPLTTQMASSKKTLKRRFEMIRNKKKTSKFVSALSAVIAVVMLGTTVFASGVLSGLDSDNYMVMWSNNAVIDDEFEFQNKAFVKNGEVYMPIRELFYIVGAVTNNDDGSYIKWDNGKIDLCVIHHGDVMVIAEHQSLNNGNGVESVEFLFKYQIEIGKSVLTENFEPNVLGRQNNSNTITMTNAPILKNGVTYIPYSYVEYMLNHSGGDCCNVNYSVYDKNGNLIDTSNNNLSVGTIMVDENEKVVFNSNNLKNPENTIEGFFQAFSDSDFTLMKNYCTSSCISTFFGDGYCFGMTRAELTDMQIDFRERLKSSNDFNVFVTVNMTPHEKSIFDKSQTSTSFYVILERQPDGRYLIDEFATGL